MKFRLSKAQVAEEVMLAFSNTCVPDDGDVVLLSSAPEYQDLWRRFKGKRWNEITVKDMVKNRNLSPFTPNAIRYFLPAYMLLLLNNPNAADTLNDLLIIEFTPPTAENLFRFERFNAVVSGLNSLQKLAIAHFLEYMCKHRARWYDLFKEPHKALSLYWNQFLQ